jgi:flagellar hook-associated protein 3 FlgL
MSIRLNPDQLPDLLAAIQQSTQNEATASEELATGQRVNQLSDDPAAAADLVANRSQSSQDDQFLQNQGTLQSKFQSADSALSNVVTLLNRAISIGTEGANGTVTAANRQSIAVEVQGLISQLVDQGNTTFQGSYLFSGTAVNTQPFSYNSSTNTVTYSGDSGVTTVNLDKNNIVTANVPGNQLFQNSSGSAFSALQDLYSSLQSGNNIGGAVTELQSALNQVSAQRVVYDNGLSQITLSESFLNQDKLDLSTQENALVGIDAAKAASDFSQASVDNTAILTATSRVLNMPNLLSYLTGQ